MTKRNTKFSFIDSRAPASVLTKFMATAASGTTVRTVKTVLRLGIHAGIGAP